MSPHWSLALRGTAAAMSVGLAAAGVGAWVSGAATAVALLYGVGIGLVVFVAIAATVSLLTVEPTGIRVLIGAGLYLGRLVFAAAAIGLPAYEGWLEAVPMVSGFAGVYIVECVALLWGAWKIGSPVAAARHRESERRVEA